MIDVSLSSAFGLPISLVPKDVALLVSGRPRRHCHGIVPLSLPGLGEELLVLGSTLERKLKGLNMSTR